MYSALLKYNLLFFTSSSYFSPNSSPVWSINDELRSVGRGARGAVTFPRLLSWQPVSTHPGAQGPSDINLINQYLDFSIKT